MWDNDENTILINPYLTSTLKRLLNYAKLCIINKGQISKLISDWPVALQLI